MFCLLAAGCRPATVYGGETLGDSDDRPPPFGVTLIVDPSVWNLLNDRAPETPGIQIQATVEADEVRDGTLFICSDRRPTDGLPCPGEGFIIIEQSLTAETTGLDPVSLEDDFHALHVEILAADGVLSVSEELMVTADSAPPRIEQISVAEDLDEDLILTAAELGLGNPTLLLEVLGANGQTLEVLAAPDGTGSGEVLNTTTVLAGAASLTVPLALGTHPLVAQVTSATGNPNLSTSPEIINPEAFITLVVNRCGNGFCDAGEDGSSCDLDCGNILANPSFEEVDTNGGPQDWILSGIDGIELTAGGIDGAWALRLENDGADNVSLKQLVVRTPPTGTGFRLSYWVNPTSLGANAEVGVEILARHIDTSQEYVWLLVEAGDLGQWGEKSVDFIPTQPVNQLWVKLIAYDDLSVAHFDAISVAPLPPE